MLDAILNDPQKLLIAIVILVGILIFLFVVRLFLRIVFYILLAILAIGIIIGGYIYMVKGSGEAGKKVEINTTKMVQNLTQKGKEVLSSINWKQVIGEISQLAQNVDRNGTK